MQKQGLRKGHYKFKSKFSYLMLIYKKQYILCWIYNKKAPEFPPELPITAVNL
jgi:hypothetical protein